MATHLIFLIFLNINEKYLKLKLHLLKMQQVAGNLVILYLLIYFYISILFKFVLFGFIIYLNVFNTDCFIKLLSF